MENHDKIFARKNIYSNSRYKSDINFRLVCKTRCKIRQALNTKSKSSSTKKTLGLDFDTYRKWIEYQMIPEMNWLNIEIYHVRPISSFDISKDKELMEAFCWKNT